MEETQKAIAGQIEAIVIGPGHTRVNGRVRAWGSVSTVTDGRNSCNHSLRVPNDWSELNARIKERVEAGASAALDEKE